MAWIFLFSLCIHSDQCLTGYCVRFVTSINCFRNTILGIADVTGVLDIENKGISMFVVAKVHDLAHDQHILNIYQKVSNSWP